MPKPSRDEVKEELKKQKAENYGDEEPGSGSPDPESFSEADDAMEKVTGHEPHKGDTMAHEVEEAEDYRRGKKAHDEEDGDEPDLEK